MKYRTRPGKHWLPDRGQRQTVPATAFRPPCERPDCGEMKESLMRIAEAILSAGMAVVLAGCLLRGNPKPATQAAPVAPKPEVAATPAGPPQPLSITQTEVELPPPQPWNPDAVAGIAPPVVEPEPEPAAPKPAHKGGPPQPPRTEAPAQPTTQPATPEPAAERPAVREIVAPEEQRELQAVTQRDRQEASRILERAGGQLSRQKQGMKKSVESYLQLSEEAEKLGDFRQARELAGKAALLAKELQP